MAWPEMKRIKSLHLGDTDFIFIITNKCNIFIINNNSFLYFYFGLYNQA